MYYLSEPMNARYEDFMEIWKQIDVPVEPREELQNG
jgi:hypothetical protein